MSFDGRDHRPGWVYPIRHHSRAILPGESVGEPLRSAYVVARHRARWLASYMAGADFRQGSQWINPQTGAATAYNELLGCRWRVAIPAASTHLIARVGLAVLAAGTIEVASRLVVAGVDGAGGTHYVHGQVGGVGTGGSSSGASPFWGPGDERGAVLTACDYDVSPDGGNVAGTTVDVAVEGFAVDAVARGISIQVLWATLHYEVRG